MGKYVKAGMSHRTTRCTVDPCGRWSAATAIDHDSRRCVTGLTGWKSMTETLGVLSEVSQEARSDDGLIVLTFRAWNPRVESWDAYIGALEQAYARYLDGYRGPMTADQTGHDPEPDELNPGGERP